MRQRRDEDHEQQHPALAERERSKGQQQQHQPGTLLAPLVGRQRVIGARGGPGLGLREQQIEVTVVGRQHGEVTAAGDGEVAQARLLEPRDGDGAAIVRHEAAGCARNRRALGRTDTEHRQREARIAQLAGRPLGGGRCAAVGDQQDLAEADTGLLEQGLALADGDLRVAAAARHDVRAEAVDQRRDRIGIVGQRRHRERVRRVDQQGRLSALLALQDVEHLQPRPRQATRRDILGIHRPRQVQRQHQRLLRAEHRLVDALPGRARQGHRRQDARDAEQQPAHVPAATGRTGQHERHQLRIDEPAPVARAKLAAREQHGQADDQRDRQQPGGAQPVEISQHGWSPPHAAAGCRAAAGC